MARALRRIVIDAAPLIAVLRNEPQADDVLAAIGDATTVVSTVTLAETVDVLERVHGWSATHIRETVEGVVTVSVELVSPTAEVATRAGSYRARHYRRRANDVSLGDCFVLATASRSDAILTSDRALAKTARAEGIDVISIPGSDGSAP